MISENIIIYIVPIERECSLRPDQVMYNAGLYYTNRVLFCFSPRTTFKMFQSQSTDKYLHAFGVITTIRRSADALRVFKPFVLNVCKYPCLYWANFVYRRRPTRAQSKEPQFLPTTNNPRVFSLSVIVYLYRPKIGTNSR